LGQKHITLHIAGNKTTGHTYQFLIISFMRVLDKNSVK